MVDILLILVNFLHLVLFIVFIWWIYLLHKDLRKGNNGVTYSLRQLVIFKDAAAEFWSLIVVSMAFMQFYVPFQLFVIGFRFLQLLAATWAVLLFVRAYRRESDVDNKSS
jgi:hypothetical protein